jgi:hypothetical protein
MKARTLLLASILVPCLLGTSPLCLAGVQDSLTFSGRILVDGTAQNQMPRFNLKLYPPKESNKPISLATADDNGKFAFTGLAQGTYLLEIYFGQDLVYQKEVDLSGSKDLNIDLRGKPAVKKGVTVRSRRRHGDD